MPKCSHFWVSIFLNHSFTPILWPGSHWQGPLNGCACVCVCVCSCSTLVISLTWTLKEKRVLNILFLSWCVHVISCYGFSARIEHKWWRHCSEWKFISIGSYWRDHTETGTSPPKEQVSFAGFCIWFFYRFWPFSLCVVHDCEPCQNS